MADLRRVELEDLTNRPGTYYNPQTEVLIVVDDSPELDTEIFESHDLEGPEWVLLSDEVPVDEHRRDELIDQFQIAHHAGGIPADEDEEDVDEEDELEPDPED